MKYFDWNLEKNEQLIKERGVSFEEVLVAIEGGYLLDIMEHTNKGKYPNQKIFIIQIEEYAYIIPFVEDDQKIFLKTIIPSRKATKKYVNKN
ncbi:MAG: BrnT family toxin [Patescibacteria group bacterium]|nr:BrnT family toxin [Patescibacteria group bacterium]